MKANTSIVALILGLMVAGFTAPLALASMSGVENPFGGLVSSMIDAVDHVGGMGAMMDEHGSRHGMGMGCCNHDRVQDRIREMDRECMEAEKEHGEGKDVEEFTGTISEIMVDRGYLVIVTSNGSSYTIVARGIWMDMDGEKINYTALLNNLFNGETITVKSIICDCHDHIRAVEIEIDGETYQLAHGPTH